MAGPSRKPGSPVKRGQIVGRASGLRLGRRDACATMARLMLLPFPEAEQAGEDVEGQGEEDEGAEPGIHGDIFEAAADDRADEVGAQRGRGVYGAGEEDGD